MRIPAEMINVFLNSMFTVFFDLVSPVSRAANPRCIIKTRKVASSIHTLFATKTEWAEPSDAKAE